MGDQVMRSYISYMGSKNPVAEHLASLMPPEASISFLDVFCGSCSPFFGKELARVNVVNDIDEQLMQMHEAVCESPEAVMIEMERLPISRLFYEEVRQLRDTAEWEGLSKIGRAARIIYLHGCAYTLTRGHHSLHHPCHRSGSDGIEGCDPTPRCFALPRWSVWTGRSFSIAT